MWTSVSIFCSASIGCVESSPIDSALCKAGRRVMQVSGCVEFSPIDSALCKAGRRVMQVSGCVESSPIDSTLCKAVRTVMQASGCASRHQGFWFARLPPHRPTVNLLAAERIKWVGNGVGESASPFQGHLSTPYFPNEPDVKSLCF